MMAIAENWQQLQDLFHSAIALTTNQRAPYLAHACHGDNLLRRSVESLIQSHEETCHFIDSPAFEAAAEMLADGNEFKRGQTLGHYEIHSALGEGGMGKVYLAEDTKLKRKVALKVLPAVHRGDEQAHRRLLREAQAAAALDHSNICAIYEVDEENDPSYIAMQYIEGETLEARIARERLSLDDALNIAVQIADALIEAHAHNIVHRDIKPSNIMLASRGQVKVLDFGLAKSARTNIDAPDEAQTKSRLTMPGVILGTVPYMSPEQVRSEPVDVRTDIFSFGAVLYEMLAGLRPFARNSAAETIAAILHHEPPKLSSIDATIPKVVEDVVEKSLAKDVGQRYQTMQQVSDDLKTVRNGAPAAVRIPATIAAKAETPHPDRGVAASTNVGIAYSTSSLEYFVSKVKTHKLGSMLATAALVVTVTVFGYYSYFAKSGETIDSIAVLPFVNVNNDPNAEYLSDGLSDSIIDSLSQLPNLKKVSAFNSVLRYKGKQTDPQTVGRDLSVRAVLMGRLTQHGDELLISAELVDAKDNKRLWGGQYKRKLADVLSLQGEIAQEISERLRLRLSGQEKQRLAKRSTADPEAYRLYLLGRFYRNQRANQKAIDYLEQAIKKDPNYAPAYAQLAYTYASASASDWFPRKEARERMEWAVQRALELDDTLGDAHAALAIIADDWSVQTREFQRALELDPNSADVHAFYARVLWARRRIDEAILHMKRAVELDPLSPALQTDLGKILYSAGQRDRAMEQYRKALELNPNYFGAHHNLARLYLAEGRYEEAIAEAEKMSANAPNEGLGRAFLGYTYAVAGKRAEAEKILHELKELSKQRHVNPTEFALIYTGLGDKNRAFEFLQKEYEENKRLQTSINILPEWDSLRSDPRFAELLQRTKLAP
jgi:serine/threonine protein kinase/Tfp pilus assembly protein PilF